MENALEEKSMELGTAAGDYCTSPGWSCERGSGPYWSLSLLLRERDTHMLARVQRGIQGGARPGQREEARTLQNWVPSAHQPSPHEQVSLYLP